MIQKQECLPHTKVVVNDKTNKWNTSMGTSLNGLVAFKFNIKGVLMDDEFEIKQGTVLEIISKPKRYNESGNQIKFKIEGIDEVFAAWWICFKHKVDKV